ncbi:peptidoglycan bridge formation glycyltransferase FemA/FemB family protein [Oscillochloris sp. ZM17-4]|uniref:lipid II:glycine glycyltransferase FemX n=1 Tax=Oscillochloris sp. ZM17-4 TaxID=2866714 RepID=UPI001C733AD2|nr:peptidoglycan bridge formation glycyltransferase FemA/FemB family protein [Oscillochloris sp. ZM17-4]MBX0327253.1 peptidoglycan bridge formation glycyltransferase FemA/FemB family protein [Oscillochloris sp. ZM17-4]
MSILARPARPRAGDLALVEPDARAWDGFVDAHPQGSLLQRSAWGALKAEAGWRPRRLAVLAADGSLRAGAQLLIRRQYGLAVAYAPRGPLLADDDAANLLLIDGLTRIARGQRAIFLRLEPNITEEQPGADYAHTWLLLQGMLAERTIQPRSSVHVPISRPTEAIFAGFSKGHRADIRRAERNGVAVRVGDESDIPAFYAIMQSTGARAGFGIHSEGYYRAAWRLFQPRSRLLLAEIDGRAVAAHMVFADAGSGRYLYSGADEAGLKAGANHLLEWQAIQWAAGLGCERYDLWGIPDALGRAAGADEAERAALERAAQADPLLGVYRFKKGFGGHVVRYLPAYDRVLIPALYGLARRRIG